MLENSGLLAFTALATLVMAATTASADVMDDIAERGTLRVGVKADYRPYGFRDEDGTIVGIEPSLAQDVADTLEVELELVPVVASNRMQFLDEGRIDLMIATMSDRPDRREVVRVVEPHYYASGTNIVSLSANGFQSWEDLANRPVCGIEGAFYNRKTEEEFGATIVAFTGTAQAVTALRQGRCLAFVYDDSFLASLLQDVDLAAYEMPLPTIDEAPWGLAVSHGEERFAAFMSDMIVDWHASGRILELETEWGIENTPYAVSMHEEHRQ